MCCSLPPYAASPIVHGCIQASVLAWLPTLEALTPFRGCSKGHYNSSRLWGLRRYAVAELVKLYPLLSMAWGVALFHEFRSVGRGAVALLAAMCAAYVAGVGLLAGARNHPQQL